MLCSKTLLYRVVFIAIINIADSKQLPAFVKRCHISDPEVGACLKENIESLKPHLRTGIPSFNIVPIDPYVLPLIRIQQEGLYDGNLTDVHVSGLHNFQIVEMKADPDDLTFSAKINLEKVAMDSDFTANGRVIILYVNGFGKSTISFMDIAATIDLKCDRIKKGNKTYLQVKDLKVDIAPKQMFIIADNVIDGSPELSQSAMQVVNDNDQLFFQIGKSSLEVVAQEALKSSISYVFEKWTMDELFPK